MNAKVYMNSKIVNIQDAYININEQNYQFGYGIFETIKLYNNFAFMLENHIDRLINSAKILELVLPFDKQSLINDIDMFINIVSPKNDVLKIIISKSDKEYDNLIFTIRNSNYTKNDYFNGFNITLSKIKRNINSPLTYIKSLNYLDNILAKKEATKKGFKEALILNTDNYISEGSMSNIFFIKNSILHTPDLNCGLLPGIARDLVMTTIAKTIDLEVITGKYFVDDLYNADELFITNSVLQIMPVTFIEDIPINNGKIGYYTKRISAEYNKLVDYHINSSL
jgi:branched-subunit amino acid aminotransferase/4-amino-4-deoxychorismate lyase